MYVCVYCGYHSENIVDFRFKLKSGIYSTQTFQCPNCKRKILGKTLKSNLTVKQLAYFIYMRIRIFKRDNYFEKIHWEELKKNLYHMGIANDFWNAWGEVKTKYKGKDIHIIEKDYDELVKNIYQEKYKQKLLAPRKVYKLDSRNVNHE